MDSIRLVLEHIFCKYPYEKLAKDAEGKFKAGSFNPIDPTTFVGNIKYHTSVYTDDTLELLYNLYLSEWLIYPKLNKPLDYIENNRKNIFHALLHFTNKILRLQNNQPVVRFEQLLRWRELSNVLGEDLLICSFLAHQECLTFVERTSFTWPSVCVNDDIELQSFSKSQFAELHFHLKGSANHFELSWICLMNHLSGRSAEFKAFDKQVAFHHAMGERNMLFSSLYKICADAAKIRLQLFRFLHNLNGEIEHRLSSFDWLIENVGYLQLELNFERERSGDPIDGYRYDYAIQKKPGNASFLLYEKDAKNKAGVADTLLDVFSGERKLMYMLFKYIYENRDTTGKVTLLFYQYLLAKAQLREELIQINRQTGFKNFANYEQRKEIFVEKYPRYKKLIPRIAIYESINEHGVGYIEARITPKKTVTDMRSAIHQLNREIEGNSKVKASSPYYYICHFIKNKDHLDPDVLWMRERHRALRITIRKQVQALVQLRKESSLLASKILALDAANTELYCRPEVFAQAYRYAQAHANYTLFADSEKLKDLKYTFHAGEDFFDIADGLRAIDESISFLNLQRGDRLGHCLALGVDPLDYYRLHHNHAVVPKLCFLDNLVWLKYKLRYYDIGILPTMAAFIEDTFEKLYREIYGNELPSMRNYYHSMRLRGDDPMCYIEPEKIIKPFLPLGWEAVCLDMQKEAVESREDEKARQLYYNYHFNKRVRTKGEEVSDFILPQGYNTAIRSLQDRFIDELTRRQIIIECCPTSNLKIGTFERYDHHPIFRFFDTGLTHISTHQLQVTINTDDQGIFATSLDNEYALIALALLKKKDRQGNSCYTRQQVLQWLEQVYNNGKKYRFGGEEQKNL